MKSKTIVSIMLAVVIICSGVLGLSACYVRELEPRAVTIEIINPNTGEVLIGGERIDLPKEKTYVEVRIKDKETGRYITDDDLPPGYTIKGSYHINVLVRGDDGELIGPEYTNNYWPEKVDPIYDYYEIIIYFDCTPKWSDFPEFQRRYETTTASIRIHLNR